MTFNVLEPKLSVQVDVVLGNIVLRVFSSSCEKHLSKYAAKF